MKTLKEAKKRLLQMHYEAGVGHIGGNLSCLEILFALAQVMTEQDKLIISKGHAAGAQYVTQWAMQPDSIDLSTFHRDGTNLAGHLPNTGSLGHGLGLAAGFALHKKLWKIPGTVYCLMSDGEWDEGSNWEALRFIYDAELSSHIKIIIDCNGYQGFKETPGICSLGMSLEAYGPFQCNGHDIDDIVKSLAHPECIILEADTIKGYGVSFLEDKLESHYDPLTYEQYQQALLEVENA
jgi:transketolase